MTVVDRVALIWFLLAWLFYGRLIHGLRRAPSITTRMGDMRVAWMHTMLGRDNRIVDASLIGNTMQSATFFASTSMIALAALLGLLGRFDQVFAAIEDLEFTAKTSRMLLEGKILLLILVFAHCFLKLTWALRQMNYCLAMIGAAPLKPGRAMRDEIAQHTGRLLSLAISSFNAGIRGYYFALAALAWILGPWTMAAVTTGIVFMLLWRQFGSATADEIRLSHAAYLGEEPLSSLPVAWPAQADPAP